MTANTKDVNLAQQGINIRKALDDDLASFENLNITPELLQQGDFLNFVNKQGQATQEDNIKMATKKLQAFAKSAKKQMQYFILR